MDSLMTIICMAIVVEGIISYAKQIAVDKSMAWQNILAILFGIAISYCYSVDIIGYFGITTEVPYISFILTGILISRGSNYVFDFIKLVTMKSSSLQCETVKCEADCGKKDE
ncbi:hypothetical protein [Methanimicrococcus blatticola]|uniref:Uncharacterized protein n=1 Tax=Methanimicrococcus blatticola TaxID=91560 RepID=A0A484F346_9EURY|nr:hypothetical protein [Methanimicrococcus blatticola]MBZ3935995.1 hypothetical protein [Methanimicrococcus blatticola]MCC2509392.1 hypothetical protein [Methanimicrococcus blatticola]TDQ68274.1 hypothetical protein C7391_1214 [Methanimicrococcus blatticola]